MLCIISTITWPILNYLYGLINFSNEEETQKKLVINSVSLTNCYTTCILGSLYFLSDKDFFREFSISLSYAYFIWDTYRIILTQSTKENMYIGHHIVGLLLLNYAKIDDYLFKSFYLAEISNTLMYPMYHLIKTRDQEKRENLRLTNNMQVIQLIIFGCIRIPVPLYYFWTKYKEMPNSVFYSSLGIYVMGVKWFVGQYNNYIKNKNKLYVLDEESKTE